MTELRECPFCNSVPCKYPQDTDTRLPAGGFRMAIWCESCGTMGPEQDHSQAAISAWNRRADDWQPIETAPRDGTRFDAWFPPSHAHLKGMVWYCQWAGGGWHHPMFVEPSHWRPLPKGPGG